MAKFLKFKPLNTPVGIAVFPQLTAPDTKFKPEGEYTVKLAFEPDAPGIPEMVAEMEKRQAEFHRAEIENADTAVKKKALEKYALAPVYTEEVDKEGEPTGRILFNFKMKASGTTKQGKSWSQKPTIIDAKGVTMKNPPDVYGGSSLRVSFETFGAPVPSSKAFYLSCRLILVKVINLVTKGGYSARDLGMDDEEEGYEADDSETSSASNSAPADSSAGDDVGGGDF